MKFSRLYLIIFLTHTLVLAQSTEEVVDEKQLMQQAIDREASSSNEAANRQEFIDKMTTHTIRDEKSKIPEMILPTRTRP